MICSYNKLISLPELPESLNELDCSYNIIKSLPELPKGVKGINCNFNNLKNLPKSLIHCRNLSYIWYYGNEIELTIQQMNFLNKIKNKGYSTNTIYDDIQNVHNSGIQKCIYDNIQVLMSDE